MPSRWRERTAASVVIALTALAFLHVRELPSDAAMFPTLTLALAAALAGMWLVATFLVRDEPAETEPFFQTPRNFAIAVGLTPVYLYLVSEIGFFTASSVYMLLLAFLLGLRRLPALLLGTAGFMASVYLVFVVLFARPLPPEFFLSAP